MLCIEALEPFSLGRSGQLDLRLPADLQKEVQKPRLRRCYFIRFLKPLVGVLAYGLEHAVTSGFLGMLGNQKRLVHKPADGVQDVAGR